MSVQSRQTSICHLKSEHNYSWKSTRKMHLLLCFKNKRPSIFKCWDLVVCPPHQNFWLRAWTQMNKMTPTTIYRIYRRTSFFRRRRFLRFRTIKLTFITFITFACKNQYFVVDWSRRVFTGEKVNGPAVYSWITLDSRYMAKISAAAYLRMRLISEYIR